MCITPFGRSVVPDVYIRRNRSLAAARGSIVPAGSNSEITRVSRCAGGVDDDSRT